MAGNPTALLKGQGDPIEQSPLVRGYVSTNRPAPGDFPKVGDTTNLLWVIVPGYTLQRPLGPCQWGAIHGATLPSQGAEVLVGFDEGNIPTVLWWAGETVFP